MNNNNLIQYAAALVAFGCTLHYSTEHASIYILDYPEDKKDVLDAAVNDIAQFANTANYSDGVASLALSAKIDDQDNPIAIHSIERLLVTLGIKQNNRFIIQELNAAKVNRSWHMSNIAGECTKFGEICTHRGILEVEGKRGRKSTREPTEYHRQSNRGIGREQLVTPNVQTLYENIPPENLISVKGKVATMFDIKMIEGLSKEELELLQAKITEFIG